ncbi:6,7-dimethyl-8-ribityllumazine synthase [Variovorax dokdonensis]|uniref:6,7-dimethyl-8-ribityllumazine synthase n=1 Tax=Variovorax dokdonensis TaxID=344883 RepID=A0ABT7NEC2_9BURK|nr:6,7-dimethyl-8-ribityllumazine synthase [Variovorax dokdonensis]MDM0046293.1 6,7-dimethyl-8-ribityllumazine synthase [Variovorax dokdonensis]
MSQINDLPLSAIPAANGGPQRIAFVQALWHRDIVDQARDAFLEEMQRLGVDRSLIDLIEVPGAFEIPLHAKRLARSGRYAAIIGCALVVDGGIYRHEFVANTVVSSLMSLQLECDVPMLSAVLTPHHFHEHVEHRKYFHRHFAIKGTEVAQACVGTLASLRQVGELASA